MNGLPYFAFYANDFVGGVKLFTTEEVGAYTLLLCYQWTNGPLPKDQADLDRIACATVSQRVRNKFQETPEGLVNERLEVERARGLTKKKNALDRLHRHRKNKHCEMRFNGVAKPVAKRLCSDSDSLSSLDDRNSTGETHEANQGAKKPTKEQDFEECWKAYPSKTGSKHKALQAFKASGATKDQVLVGVARYIAYVEHRRATDFPGLNYKNGQTWFNGREWQTEYATGQAAVADTTGDKVTCPPGFGRPSFWAEMDAEWQSGHIEEWKANSQRSGK